MAASLVGAKKGYMFECLKIAHPFYKLDLCKNLSNMIRQLFADFGIYLNDGNTSNANYIVEVVKNLDDIENDETESNISGNVVESYKCNQCDKEYQTAEELDLHNQLHKPYLCEECSQSFATISNLSEHIMSEHDENYRDSFTKCKICSFVAINRRTLLQHMIVHLSIAKLPCKICPEIAPNKDSLWEHFRIKHAELEPAETVEVQQCLTCEATFFEEEEFMEHLKQYRSEAPYKCKYCRSKFYEIKEVETHLNERHSDKTNHAKMCKFCTRLIPLSSFNKHLQLHLDVYFCDLCQRTFTSVDILTQHRLNYHQQAQNIYFIDELRKKDKKYVEEVLHAFEAHEKWESA